MLILPYEVTKRISSSIPFGIHGLRSVEDGDPCPQFDRAVRAMFHGRIHEHAPRGQHPTQGPIGRSWKETIQDVEQGPCLVDVVFHGTSQQDGINPRACIRDRSRLDPCQSVSEDEAVEIP